MAAIQRTRLKYLYKAIMDKYNASDLPDLITGLYLRNVPQDLTSMPYIVMMMVSNVPIETFNRTFYTTLMQFSIFSASTGIEELDDVKDIFNFTFDWCNLTIAHASFISCQKVNEVMLEDIDCFQYVMDYEIMWESD